MSAMAAGYGVKAKVTDAVGAAQEFATYRIFSATDTVKPVAYGVTDQAGLFSARLNAPGSYKARVTIVGLKDAVKDFELTASAPEADLGNLVCAEADNMLGEVTVTATRPLVVKEIDRIGYDVQADGEAKTSNLQEMLRKVPLVSVDPDGTIKVKGSSDFKIYKNGRPNNSFTNNAKEIFKAIPASMIKKIEVITDPGAREDAEGVGAILNIVTVQGTTIKGVMANVGLNYNSNNNLPNPNLWGSAQIDKVTLSAYGGGNFMSRRSSKSSSVTDGVYEDSGNVSHDESRSSSSGAVTWWGIEGSYEPDTLNLVALEFGGYYYRAKSRSEGFNSLVDRFGNPIYSYSTRQLTDPSSYLDFNGAVNYQHSTRRKGEMLTFSYMISTTIQKSTSTTDYLDPYNMPVDYNGIYSDFKLDFSEHTFQFDWTRPFAKIHVLDLGMKYIFRDNNSKTLNEYLGTDRRPATDFTHHTHIAAAFADYRVRMGRFALRGGLRYEFSRLSAKYAYGSQPSFGSNLSDWVPNAAVSYDISDRNNLKVAYSTRINRPGISYLNPAVSESPSSTSQGNPDLGSSRNSSINLNYSLISQKVTIEASAGYTFANNAIVAVQRVEGNHTYSGYANAGRNKGFESSLFLQWSAGRKTTLMLNAGAYYNHYSNPSLDIARGGWGGNAFFRLTQRLPWKLSGVLGAYLWTGGVSLYSDNRPVHLASCGYNISFNRNFLKEDRLSVRLTLQNPIYPGRLRYKTESFNTSYKTVGYSYQEHLKSIMLSVSYRFGSMSASVKKTSKSISNDDLVGRKNE